MDYQKRFIIPSTNRDVGSYGALILIVAAILFGANLGTWFSVAMVAFNGSINPYNTQRIMQSYPAHAYVGASVTLFASS